MGASCIDAVSVLQGAHGGHERLAVDDPLHPPVVAPALVEDAEFADAALQPLRMSSERMHVEAWIAALDPVESRQGLRAVLGRETAKVVERSPRKGDGHRPLAPIFTKRISPQWVEVRRTRSGGGDRPTTGLRQKGGRPGGAPGSKCGGPV